MLRIVALIASLQEHLAHLMRVPQDYRPKQCPRCGRGRLWCHGEYYRKADRDSGKLNPIPVPRFYCPGCEGTCSCLPSCIPPRRWYLWEVQQAVLGCLLSGTALEECARQLAHLGPAASTMRRWWRWLKARHVEFSFHLKSRQPEWGRAKEWREFWRSAMTQEPLRELMAYLDNQGVTVP